MKIYQEQVDFNPSNSAWFKKSANNIIGKG